MTLSALTRSWPTLAAWGAGLLQIGIGAGLITRGTDAGARGVGILLVTVGAAGFLWGAAALARGGMSHPRIGTAIGLGGTVTAAVALLVDPAGVSVYAAAVAVALWLVCAISAALAARRRTRAADDEASDPSRVRRTPPVNALGIIVGAVVVAVVVTPALSAAEEGRIGAGGSSYMFEMPGHGH